MNDLTGAATEAARQENTEKILDTAERLFRHYGYNKTNVADIARELSMSSGNIYRFFASKADIQQALVRRMLAAQFQAVKAQAAGPGTATERLKQHLILVHKMTVETMLDEEKVHEMVVVAMDQQWPVIQEHLQQIRLVVTDLIREGIAAGEFRDQNPVLAAESFMCCGVTLCHPELVAKKIATDECITPAGLADFIIQALK
ncbi:TetR/AcrR family transcriptional regulator [Rhizobium sp. SSA_523]|uniref:TetR/AcrR family transcriptional regulator n=1 Tax=Rhizobium sp. SSA_523 TaxID=2952477 RepID=UPI002091047A|nr:TetR family transcriptional regulator [Rhizobium sp. SSA_523]MCO5731749.1 TetR/AcrR family transcriptional regulator [Rhizobium sp. SSA_523]WKC22880.1 TetR family transcriptional regulator [Rhizobium sp. SSA_523]